MAETANSAHDCASTSKSMSGPGDAAAGQIGDDTAILAAWARRCEAYAQYNAEPVDVDNLELLAVVDAADEQIHSLLAMTPEGVSVQLWAALMYTSHTKASDERLQQADLDRLHEDPDFDWNDRLIIAALRSLRAMGMANKGLPAARGCDDANCAPSVTQPLEFAPSEWIVEFERVGGAYALTDGGLHLCIIPGDRSDAELGKARLLIVGLSLEDKKAIADELRARQVMEASHGNH